jgi:hypothetical protein
VYQGRDLRVFSERIQGVVGIALLAAAALSVPAPVTRILSLPAGHAHARFRFVAEVGVAFRDVRLVVPHGADVDMFARDVNKQMGVDVSTRFRDEPVSRCVRAGRYDICDQQQQACPILNANWIAAVTKRSAAPARIRVVFVFTRSG